jgi:GTPase SAR1 family protein
MVEVNEMSTKQTGDDVAVVNNLTLKVDSDSKSFIRRHDYLFKIIMLGDTQTGKTNLLSRWDQDQLQNNFNLYRNIKCSVKEAPLN